MFSKISNRQLHSMAAELASIPDNEQRMQSAAEFHRQKRSKPNWRNVKAVCRR